MLYAVSGKILAKKDHSLILQVGNFQLEIWTIPRVLEKNDIGKNISLFTCLYLREKSLELYGFENEKEQFWFNKMIGISGIGPKLALNILSVIQIKNLESALREGNPKVLTEISGIGPKTASRIAVELQGKVKTIKNQTKEDAAIFETLKNLGFSSQESNRLISQIPENIKGKKERLQAALKMATKI